MYIIIKYCLHYYDTFYKILLILIEIQSTIFVSRQPAMQNI